MKSLFLLDAFALIYRAYFAFGNNHRFTSDGLNTSAILGFTNTLIDVLKNDKPDHIAVVFDRKEPTFRHIEYPQYKAQRQEIPEGIVEALPHIKAIIKAFNIPLIEKAGFEADDIIGTLAHRGAEAGMKVYMMTPDKDYAQLVQENVIMYKPARSGKPAEKLGVKEILVKWEIDRVEQVIDILGLWGDASDNIPGVPGIGEKTSKKLMKIYGSIEGLIANAHELKGKQKENVINFADQARLSKRLATIVTDVDVPFEPEKLKTENPDENALKEIFAKLEFRTLAKRYFGESAQPNKLSAQLDLFGQKPAERALPGNASNAAPTLEFTSFKTLDESKVNYKLIDTKAGIDDLVKKLAVQKSFCFDTETTGLDPITGEMVGIAFCFKAGEAFYVPTPSDQNETQNILNEFKGVLENPSIEKIAQNIKFDIQVLEKYKIKVQGKFFDTMLAHYLIAPSQRHNMDHLARTYLQYEPVSITELIGKKGKNQGTMRDVAVEKVCPYACEDADITLQLKEKLEPELEKNNLRKLFDEVEIPLLSVLSDMEMAGVKVDTEALAKFSEELEKGAIEYEKEIYKIAGTEFNIASPKQLGEVLFDLLKLDSKAKKTKTGQYKTDEAVLNRLANKHEIAQKVIDYRQNKKLKSTYVDAIPALINPITNRVHTSFNQAVASTGRLSSNNPNLQNIPIRTEKGREVRKAFVPRDENYTLLSADYSQVELRIMTHFSKEKNMLEDFKQGIDIHSATAAKVYKIALEDVTSDQRRKAKMVNFGLIYGISAFGLSQRLGIPRSEASELMQNYFATYSGIKDFMDEITEKARKDGYVETILGRRRYLPDINSANSTVRGFAERNAINAPIQGSAADMIKVAMINIQKEMKAQNLQSKMTLQVHDELVFDAYKPELKTLKKLVESGMQNAIPLDVPVVVDMDTGVNWLEAH